MENIKNIEPVNWKRPWMLEKFDDLYNRDERFFSIFIKGCLGWLSNNIILYNKQIKHYIFNTGSAYMYIESNGYEYSWSETTGEDSIYMQMPRCIVELGSINIPTDELSNSYSRGIFELNVDNEIKGFNAEIKRIPIEIDLTLKYVLSNFNESIILIQELIDKIIFQKYFNITYLGQIIHCSIEFPADMQVEINKIDMTSAETNQKTINITVKCCTNYPIINEKTLNSVEQVINTTQTSISLNYNNFEVTSDTENKTT